MSSVEGLEADLKADRTEARDQEQRLKVRITALEGEMRQKSNEPDECSATIKSMSEQQALLKKLSLTEKPREGHMADTLNKKRKSRREGKMCMTPKKALELKPRTARPKVKKNPRKINGRARNHSKHQAKRKRSNGVPVHVPHHVGVQRKSEVQRIQSDDKSWKLVVPKKPMPEKAVIYVGNLSPETTEYSLISFITQRSERVDVKAPTVYHCRVFPPKDSTNPASGASITVPVDAVDVLTDRSFWPRPAFARRWVFPKPASHTSKKSAPKKPISTRVPATKQRLHRKVYSTNEPTNAHKYLQF